jgi:DDE superfamily endonuclease
VSDSTVSRVIGRVLPLLEQAGRDTMRLPDPGKKHRRTLDALLAALPEVVVIIDRFEQRVQRPRDRQAADALYSGKKKQHTLKSQLAVDEDGRIVDVAASVRGPTADLTLLAQSGLLERLPPGVGGMGDLA